MSLLLQTLRVPFRPYKITIFRLIVTPIRIYDIKRTVHSIIDDEDKGINSIAFIWVPSHVGIGGNEIADWLAKQGTTETAREEFRIPADDFKGEYKKNMVTRTKNKLRAEFGEKGKFYLDNYYEESAIYLWFEEIRGDRFFMTTINRLRANHFNLGESLERKGYIDSARCACGAEVESLDHVVWQCSKFDEQRITLRERLDKSENVQPYCVWTWIKKKRYDLLKIVCNFLFATKKFI